MYSPFEDHSETTICAILFDIALIAIGAVYLGQCPRQPCIPVYLLVLGCFGTVRIVLSWCLRKDNIIRTICKDKTGPLFACWFGAGNVWIYSIYEPNYDKTLTLETNSTNSTLAQYCDKTVYQIAIWTITLPYIFLASNLIFCLALYLCGCSGKERREERDMSAGSICQREGTGQTVTPSSTPFELP